MSIALIGCGGRGIIVTRGLNENGAHVTCLCDLHQERLETTAKEIVGTQGGKPITVKLMRQVFDSKDVDAVAEQFIGDAEANKLVKRKGRGKYQIPEQV